jgi:hypothetical protein
VTNLVMMMMDTKETEGEESHTLMFNAPVYHYTVSTDREDVAAESTWRLN